MCAILLLCAIPVPGQPPPEPRQVVRATGEATVSARPDRATVNVGVVTQAPSAQDAAAQNARQLETALAELRKALGAGADIKTVNYSLSPNYHYNPNAPPTITGYTASNTVQVTTGDLTGLGKIIDVATHSGANTIQSLHFSVKDERPVRAQALKEAALLARANAEAMASALNLKVVRVVDVVEATEPIARPIMRDMAMAAAATAPATQVEAGAIQIRATVTVTLQVE